MPSLLHVVSLRFRADLSDAEVESHMRNDVALKRRMPELVEWWTFKRNVTLLSRADSNGGCGWVVISKLYRAEDLPAYLAHAEHQDVARIQSSLITGKHVVDFEVGAGEFLHA